MDDSHDSHDTDSPSETWAPQSPDLSNYHSGSANANDTYSAGYNAYGNAYSRGSEGEPFVHPQHRAYRGSISSATSGTQTQQFGSSPVVAKTYLNPSLDANANANTTMPRGVKKEESLGMGGDEEYLPDAQEVEAESKTRGKRTSASASASAVKNESHGEESSGLTSLSESGGAPAAEIVIKNHFPVARIKRIMQADDDVGKVAQVTPVVVCMSLFFPFSDSLSFPILFPRC